MQSLTVLQVDANKLLTYHSRKFVCLTDDAVASITVQACQIHFHLLQADNLPWQMSRRMHLG